MSSEIILLAGAAASIGLIHTILGPDHYLPFIVLSKAMQWSKTKTIIITFLCGVGHVLGSVLLGFIGIAMGLEVFKLKAFESFRAELAAWLLIAFGFAYFVWGIHRAIRNRPHQHLHLHQDGKADAHLHTHTGDHTHVHTSRSSNITPWILFTIFIFGPCEPLIPLIMYPAAKNNMMAVTLVVVVFAVVTISAMVGVVLLSYQGLAKVSLSRLAKYSHAIAGLTILLCGGAIKFLGL